LREGSAPTIDPMNDEIPQSATYRWGLGEVAIGYVLLALASGLIAALFLPASSAPLTLASVLLSLASAWIGFLGAPIYAVRGHLSALKEQFGLKFVLPADALRGICVGIVGQVMVAIIYLPLHFLDPSAAKSVSNPANMLTSVAHGWRWIPYALAVAVISPFCEELFFRGLTMRALAKKWGPMAGIVISGLLFGITHFEGIQTPALVGFGWILAWRATKTGRIGETIVAHGSFNAITLISIALSN
jgi:uncharacterized protein